MESKSKNKTYKTKTGLTYTIDNNMPDYGNDPFFITKARESKEFLEKHGFPEELLKIREERLKKRFKSKITK